MFLFACKYYQTNLLISYFITKIIFYELRDMLIEINMLTGGLGHSIFD